MTRQAFGGDFIADHDIIDEEVRAKAVGTEDLGMELNRMRTAISVRTEIHALLRVAEYPALSTGAIRIEHLRAVNQYFDVVRRAVANDLFQIERHVRCRSWNCHGL